ncbi:phage tail protein [Chromobacterium violaceum]|uniref:Phage tail protein n=1 Tax=Chromobacterium violaceum TaxID=536 RepID=A0A202B2F3_CHRVL|nr:phage tail protein [Chromobacterium violaceum]OVE45663.1 phage tail protein [Chromobacterium violaceum]
MPIYPADSLNTAALQAPDLYLQIVPPKTRYINGVATDILGIVGVGSWGPVNSPMLIGSPGDVAQKIGAQQVRKYDLASACNISIQLGASNIRGVRVSDGTDAAATSTLKDTGNTAGVNLTAYYTGSVGNTLSASLGAGTANGTWKFVVGLPGVTPETYDNLGAGLSGAALWAAIASAINNGTAARGPSQLVTASVGSSTAAPAASQAVTFTGGTDGASSVTDATLIGTDGSLPSQRKGMYALRGTGAQVVNLIDLTDSTQWPSMVGYGLSEGAYVVTQGPAGASYSTVSTSLNTAGCDSYALKVLVGDWLYWQDSVNGQLRMMAPATFTAAKIAALAPHQSPLNKPMSNVVATQRTQAQQPYSLAEIGAINSARLDVITNPCPGGNYYGARAGLNCSSNPSVNGDNYTRMTNFISLTMAGAFGFVVGQLQTPDLWRSTKATIDSFLLNLQQQGMIQAFGTQLDGSNNPDSRVALGYMQADVQVKYLSVVRYFLINLEAGQSVNVTVSASPRS